MKACRDSVELVRFHNKWIGKQVLCRGVRSIMGGPLRDVLGKVDGVCDDGARCDNDSRRKFKPTGQLIVINLEGVTEYLMADNCEVLREL